jgi:hypothetical protein
MGVLPTSAKIFFAGDEDNDFEFANGRRINDARRGEMRFVCSNIELERRKFQAAKSAA